LLAGLVAVLLTATAAPALAEPAKTYDADGQAHADRCVRLAGSAVPLRYLDGAPTGFTLSDAEGFSDGSCPAGTIRLDLHEIVDSPAGPLVFERGGNGYEDAQNAKYGQVALSDLADPVGDPVPAGGGRGNPCPLVGGSRYAVAVQSIPENMKYKRPQDVPSGNNTGASFLHYGDPGADQGDRHDVHYSYLVWSFVDARGGGHVRALLEQGQVVQPCDVDPILMQAFDRSGNVNGSVLARYVRTEAGGTPLYGWMVWEHDAQDGNGPIAHSTWLAGPTVATPADLRVSPPVSRPPPPVRAPSAQAAMAPAPPPPPPPPAPLPMRALADVARAVVDRRGSVRIPLACTGTAAMACAGSVRLAAALPGRHGRFSSLAQRRYTIRSGAAATVIVNVGSSMQRRLPRHRPLRALVTVLTDGQPSVVRSLALVRQ
jgi:hypothetical protein